MSNSENSSISNKIDIGIKKDSLEKIVLLLNNNLASEYVLLTKTKNYHWNVIDPRFNDLHKFFDEQYSELEEMIDELAERIRSLGGKAKGTLYEFIQNSIIKEEEPNLYPDANTMLENLLKNHESIIKRVRQDIDECENLHDVGTADFLTSVMEKHEKMAWMLRSFLE